MSASIGASEAAVILGLQRRRRDGSPYTSELELWARLRGLLPRYDDDTSPAAEAGHAMEPGILLRLARELGATVVPGPPLDHPGWSRADLPWLHARPDGLLYDGASPLAVAEAKAPRELDPEEGWGPGPDEVPSYYLIQALVQLAVCAPHGWSEVVLGAHARDARRGDRVWAVYRIPRDERREARLLHRLSDWHRRHVEDGIPPMPDGSESAGQTLARIWRPADTTVEASPTDVETLHRLLSVRSALDELEVQRRELEQRLQARMGEATALQHDGRTLATWRARRGADRIDTARLRRELPDVARTYTTTGADGRTWRIG